MRLQIVVAPDCRGCEQAEAIARDLRERFPTLEVDLVQLDGRAPLPDGVVATPTYFLDGAIVSLGNPRREGLIREIKCRLAGRARRDR